MNLLLAWEATNQVALSEIAAWQGWPETGARQQNASIGSKRPPAFHNRLEVSVNGH